MALFTSETAADMARKSAESKRLRLENLRNAVADAVGNPEIDFKDRTLSRVRLQMENLSDEIDEAIDRADSKKVKELTDAYTRLGDMERILAGRPLPGSKRPAPERASKRGNDSMPSPIAPATPQAESQPTYNPATDPNAPNG